MSTIGRAVLDDAVIQRVRNDSLATNCCLVAEFCLQTCRVDDLSLGYPWSLQARGDDDIGGLVLYWKVHFSYGESGPSSYSTQPGNDWSSFLKMFKFILGLAQIARF